MQQALEKMGVPLKLSTKKTRGEGFVFKLHYRATCTFIAGCCVLVTATQYCGDPIECMPDKDTIPQNVIDNYCYVTYTYTIPRYHDEKVGIGGVPHWGVGPEADDDERVYHNYYMWVPYMLCLQAISFYVPHSLWKAAQMNKVDKILMGLDNRYLNEKEKEEKVELLASYLKDFLHTHNLWAFKYMLCETLNFVNVVLQIFITDAFLGHEFMKYGPRAVRFLWADPDGRKDPMYEVFPRVTKCNFWKYGPSGTVQKHDALCVLAINIINEKIYVLLWFWLVILAILSGLAFIYRLATFFSPTVRTYLLRQHVGLLGPGSGQEDGSTLYTVDSLINRFQYGDWYLMYSLGRNMGKTTFTDVLKVLERKLNSAYSRDDVNNEKNLLQGKDITSGV